MRHLTSGDGSSHQAQYADEAVHSAACLTYLGETSSRWKEHPSGLSLSFAFSKACPAHCSYFAFASALAVSEHIAYYVWEDLLR